MTCEEETLFSVIELIVHFRLKVFLNILSYEKLLTPMLHGVCSFNKTPVKLKHFVYRWRREELHTFISREKLLTLELHCTDLVYNILMKLKI